MTTPSVLKAKLAYLVARESMRQAWLAYLDVASPEAFHAHCVATQAAASAWREWVSIAHAPTLCGYGSRKVRHVPIDIWSSGSTSV